MISCQLAFQIPNELHFNPFIPEEWNSYSFMVKYRNSLLKIEVTKDKITVFNQNSEKLKVFICGVEYHINNTEPVEYYYR